MNNETMMLLDQHFDVAFAAPDGIKKLRELILTLAMQGKLVPQDHDEGSVQELIQEINDWKIKMVKEKVFLKSGKSELNGDDLKLYQLPKSWCWTRIGIICGSIVPSRDKPKSFSGGYPWVTVSNFDNKGIKLLPNHSGLGLSEWEVQKYNAQK
jgi:type I restriction enzyme, S subunit